MMPLDDVEPELEFKPEELAENPLEEILLPPERGRRTKPSQRKTRTTPGRGTKRKKNEMLALTTERPHSCDLCGLVFDNMLQLEAHR